MTAMTARTAMNAEQAGGRVEEVLDRLAATGDREVAAAAEELVRVLMDFYGAGLARIVELLGAGPLAGLLGDELVSSLLVLHELHPEDRDSRIARALETVRQHAVEVAEFDEATGTLRLRSAGGGGCGCGSTGGAVQQEVQDALACFAPEVTAVELETAAAEREPVLLQIGRPSAVEAP
jgi:Fe-S cluster biogenesis protein NfuA